VADLEKRIQSAEQRIESMQRRIEQNQKTIESVERGISTSTGLAIEIEEGTGRAEDRLDSAIARTERIKGIIADIEKANR
jgi:predicted  nucleic acid-binding Zn-ribbon protein